MSLMINSDPVIQLLGFFYITVGISFIAAPGPWRQIIDIMTRNDVAVLISGGVAFLVGLSITLFCAAWTDDAHILLTIVGYVALIEGIVFLCAPGLSRKFISSGFYQGLLKYGGYISIIFGALFLFI